MNNQNLKPFKSGYDPRRQNGRKQGSKNNATLVKEFMDTGFENLGNKNLQELIAEMGGRNAREALILSLLMKSLSGDFRAAEFLLRYGDTDDTLNSEDFNKPIEIKIIKSENKALEDDLLWIYCGISSTGSQHLPSPWRPVW